MPYSFVLQNDAGRRAADKNAQHWWLATQDKTITSELRRVCSPLLQRRYLIRNKQL